MQRKFAASKFFQVLALAVGMCSAASVAQAHFPWLKTETVDDKPRAVMVFGESPNEEDYKLPAKLAGVKVWQRTSDGKRAELVTEKVETENRVGLVAPLAADQPSAVEMSAEYGIYGNWLLTYYAKHIHCDSNAQLATVGPSPELKLDIVPSLKDDALELTVLWQGKPRPDTAVTVAIGNGAPQELKTDAEGKVAVNIDGDALVGVVANLEDKDAGGGERDGKKYTTMAHFATLTFPWVCPCHDDAGSADSSAAASATLPPLPEAVSSFGAVVCDGWLYVYSGHTGTEHDHSAANQSKHFIRAKIDRTGKASGTEKWEELAMQTSLQGLALVAHGGKVYRIGGMNARNATIDDDADLHSVAEFAVYDPAKKEWTPLAPLPAARSSHNATVIGDKLYVTGGWTLDGEAKGTWLDDSLVFDFTKPSEGWQKLPAQAFQRRALAAGESRGRLVAIGGMDENEKISQRVDVFDPSTGVWTEGPALPGKGMAGFGVSAWNLDGDLYVSGFQGKLYRWDGKGSEWEEVARLAKPRFFHQLVPAGVEALFAVGGATREGHLVDIERIDVSGTAAAPTPAAATERTATDTEKRDRA